MIGYYSRTKWVINLIMTEKNFFHNIVHDVFHEEIYLMSPTSNLNKRTLVVHSIIELSDNSSNRINHVVCFIKSKTNR